MGKSLRKGGDFRVRGRDLMDIVRQADNEAILFFLIQENFTVSECTAMEEFCF